MAAALLLLLAACRPAARAQAPAPLRLTTGTPGATFYPLGQALAGEFGRTLPGVQIVIQDSAGSVSNVERIQARESDIGLSFADVAYIAYVGRLHGSAEPFNRLRGIAVLQLTPLHLVVRGGSAIHDVSELRGRRVGLGPPGSGTALTAGLVLDAHGVGPGVFDGQTLRFNEAAGRLMAGTLDAMFVNAGFPAESVRAAMRSGATLLSIEGPAIDQLRHNYPFLRLTNIPAETYPGQRGAIHTIGVDTILVCRSDLDEALVYDLTRRFFESLPTLSSSQESLRRIDLEQAPATPIPLHEGAARYFRERELLR
jgi:TRAP transporter TAXI family solute receptor